MKHNALIRPAAQAEIDQQAGYLAEHASEAIAYRYLEAVNETIRLIIESPNTGGPWTSDHPLLQDVRKHKVIGFPNQLLFYRHAAGKVELLHLFHGKQDISSRFNDGLEDAP